MTRKLIFSMFYFLVLEVGVMLVVGGLGVHPNLATSIGIALIVSELVDWRMDGVK
ncbi:hypothetical protein PQ472_07870 [Lacticaseibacillus pabuli]|uniref:Uncharacterized protein n=1 Tax=Lacticaseibacillus pabuli TaxID=3025672 RepID=A0ABY7WNR0_9LACO|nr:hypothetical protein [Lacticaseibacillus sp. KACC 23028]WDF81842.1 hypothetical protein PQ472_07870 [Lacticaseibacillus sp. KACC 23028]